MAVLMRPVWSGGRSRDLRGIQTPPCTSRWRCGTQPPSGVHQNRSANERLRGRAWQAMILISPAGSVWLRLLPTAVPPQKNLYWQRGRHRAWINSPFTAACRLENKGNKILRGLFERLNAQTEGSSGSDPTKHQEKPKHGGLRLRLAFQSC